MKEKETELEIARKAIEVSKPKPGVE